MLKDRQELEVILNNLIIKNNDLRVVSNAIKDLFLSKGMPIADFTDAWTQRKELNEVDMTVLFTLTKGLYDVTKDEKIKLENWFTETEIRDGNNYVYENIEKKIEYPLVIPNVLKGKEDQYVFYLPAQTIKLWFDSGLLPYNFDTQRNPKIKKDEEGELIKTANINVDSVNEIGESMEDGSFITNCITLNLLQDNTDRMEYNRKKELIIYSGQINPIDGFHRIQGMLVALARNPDLDYITEVRFTNWGEQKCKNFIFQEDKRNKIDGRYMGSIIDINKMGNKVVTSLNESTSDMRGKIVTDVIYINNDKALTLFDVMSDTIDELYELKSNKDVMDLSKWLGMFFDYIIGSYPDEFIDNIGETKKISVINMPLTFVGYLALSKQLHGRNDWEDKLTNILLKIDFSIDNPIWEEIGIIRNGKTTINFTKTIMKKIINYFNNIGGVR